MDFPSRQRSQASGPYVKDVLNENVSNQRHSPAKSPDPISIEHLWDHRDRKIREHAINNKDDLQRVLDGRVVKSTQWHHAKPCKFDEKKNGGSEEGQKRINEVRKLTNESFISFIHS